MNSQRNLPKSSIQGVELQQSYKSYWVGIIITDGSSQDIKINEIQRQSSCSERNFIASK